jgi:hypothetical protein
MTSIMRAFGCAVLASCLLSQPLRAEDVASRNLVITQAWSRATPGGPVPGRWSLGLGITISASETVNVASPILIR